MSFLTRILESKAGEVRKRKAQTPLAKLRARCAAMDEPRDFQGALRERMRREGMAVIAEIKKASPSKGVLRPDFAPREIALSYASAGAACLSILTDAPYFQGNDQHLAEVRQAVSLPCLRKDFIINPYQVFEARTLGADCVLLIAAALSQELLTECQNLARDLGMQSLVEIHNASEVARALASGADMIGINNRNLETFETSLMVSAELRKLVPENLLLVSESGISRPEDVRFLRQAGISCFLIGEAFMRAADPGAELGKLLTEAAEGSAGLADASRT